MASVEEIIDDQRGFASEVLGDARTALNEAINVVTGIGYLQPDPQLEPMDPAPEVPVIQDMPEFGGVDFQLPPEPGSAPEFQTIGPIDISGMPVSRAEMPTLVMPSQPSAMPDFTEQAPDINTSYEFPEPPDQLMNPLIPEPQLIDRAAPDKPNVVLPIFDAAAPEFDAQAPTDLAAMLERSHGGASASMMAVLDGQAEALLTRYCPGYHQGMASMEARLAELMKGGSGFRSDAERAVMERAKDRDLGEYRRVRDSAWADAADRGHKMPTGALLSAQFKARQAAADNIARANADLVARQAELEQQNLQFTISTSLNLRQSMLSAMLSYHGNLVQINGQALEHAKAVVGMVIETYNIAVKAYEVRQEAWRAKVALHEVQIKAALSAIELYKAEIDALQAQTQVDLAKVNVYRARVETLQTLAGVYRSRIDSIISRAGLEKLKLDLFQSRVQVRVAQVQAKANEWAGYRAALDGEDMKVRLYSSQIQGDAQAVAAWRGKIEGQSEAVRAAAITNDSMARMFEVKLREYGQTVSARSELARTQIEGDRHKLLTYQARVTAAVSQAQTSATIYRAKADVSTSYADARMRAISIQQSSMHNYQATVATLATANANVHSQLAGQTLSGLSALAIKEG